MSWNKVIEMIDSADESEWIDALPKKQKDELVDLIIAENRETAAAKWLEKKAVDSISAKGMESAELEKSSYSYVDLVKKEVRKLLCGDKEYENDRDEISKLIKSDDSKKLFVSTIAALIGVKIGIAAAVIAPIIVLILMTIAKITINAWCELKNPAKELL